MAYAKSAIRWQRARERLNRCRAQLQRASIAEHAARVALEKEMHDSPSHLSPRQVDVLRMIREYKQNKEIAAELNISMRTAKFHVSALLEKFQVRHRYELYKREFSPEGQASP